MVSCGPSSTELTRICNNFIWCSVCRVCLPIQTVSSVRPAKFQHMFMNLCVAGCKGRLRDGLRGGKKGGEATSYPSWTFPPLRADICRRPGPHTQRGLLCLWPFPSWSPLAPDPLALSLSQRWDHPRGGLGRGCISQGHALVYRKQ